uniref:TIL domain-containing protein n=1 Tax=Paramormyrops kingsleyae TaxID=1676925 RepID=A0A3B3T2S9_9TELE
HKLTLFFMRFANIEIPCLTEEMECPENSHYELCGSECGLTCGYSSFNATCTQSCSEGCFCDEGYFRQGSSCVPTEQCGCQYGGFSFKVSYPSIDF